MCSVQLFLESGGGGGGEEQTKISPLALLVYSCKFNILLFVLLLLMDSCAQVKIAASE